MKLGGASLLVEITCGNSRLNCLHRTTIKVPLAVFDNRGVTINAETPHDLARHLPDDWFFIQPTHEPELDFICEPCRLARGYKRVTWGGGKEVVR